MPASTDKTTGLADGTYLALAPAELRALRAVKGDRARRDHVARLDTAKLALGDAWWFLAYLGGADLARGRSLHRGQMHRIELLEREKLAGALAKLAALDLRAAFFAIDEQDFRYHHVAFWVSEQWQREGRATVLDDHVFARVERGRVELERFVVSSAGEIVFTTSY